MSRKQRLILYQLTMALIESGDFISARSLSDMLNTSERNIRNKLDDLDFLLNENNLGYVERAPRKGTRIVYKNEDRIRIAQLFEDVKNRTVMPGEKVLYTYLRVILSSDKDKMTVNQLSDIVFDSVPVCSKNVDECAEWLSLFNIKLTKKKNLGIVLEGREENKRLAIKHLVIRENSNEVDESILHFAKGVNLDLLKTSIREIENEWNFKFADESFNSMLLYAALAITRSKYGEISLAENEKEIVQLYNEYSLAQSLFSKISSRFSIHIEEEEIKYFAIQLLCSKMIHSTRDDCNYHLESYDEKLKTFVTKIINVVSEILNIDLNQDAELYYGLLNHIRPAIFRMKFEKHRTNDLANFIKEEFKHTYRVSWALSILFEEYYGIKVSSVELSYITLYIQTSLDRHVKPLKIALVTELGMGLNQMFCNRIKMSIPKIDDIDIYNYHDFRKSVISNYDLVVTTSELGFTDSKVIQINSLLSGNGIEVLNEKIESIRKKKSVRKSKFDPRCHSYFDPKLLLIKPKVKNKKELLKLMCSELEEYGYVNEKYLETVMEREGSVSTNIGNKVAIPHGNHINVNESKIVVATLDNEIEWNNNENIKIVFLLALKVNNKFESHRMQLFYKEFLNIIDTDQDVEKILNMNNEELYKFLVR